MVDRYLDRVVPGTYGRPLPWWFPASPLYWQGKVVTEADNPLQLLYDVLSQWKGPKRGRIAQYAPVGSSCAGSAAGHAGTCTESDKGLAISLRDLRKVSPANDSCLSYSAHCRTITVVIGYCD